MIPIRTSVNSSPPGTSSFAETARIPCRQGLEGARIESGIMKLGIGIASWAHGHVNAYATKIRDFEDADLVACWDDDEERGRRNAESFGMAYSSRLEDLLENPDVDCVIVASETNKHGDICVAAAE